MGQYLVGWQPGKLGVCQRLLEQRESVCIQSPTPQQSVELIIIAM
jgi:hypothetical protein